MNNRMYTFSSFATGIALLCILLVFAMSYSQPAQATQLSGTGSHHSELAPGISLKSTLSRTHELVDFTKRNLHPQEKRLPLQPANLEKGENDALTSLVAPNNYPQVGAQHRWPMYDFVCQGYTSDIFTLRKLSTYAEVWVQNDLSYKKIDGCESYNLTPNLLHPLKPTSRSVPQEAIDELVTHFDAYIWPTLTNYYGTYSSRTGEFPYISRGLPSYLREEFGTPSFLADNGERVVILIGNIRDGRFYDPLGDGISGVYDYLLNDIVDRNVVTLNSQSWDSEQGHYQSVLAHEFQHLISLGSILNFDEAWVDEGLAQFAEFLVGYRTSAEHGRLSWHNNPENSLIVWGDQGGEIRADYKMAYLFLLYTAGRLGGDEQSFRTIAALASGVGTGIGGFNEHLASTNSQLRFEQLYRDFRLQLLHGGDTDDEGPKSQWNAGYIGSYVSPLANGGGEATSKFALGGLRESLTIEGYSAAGAPPFGSDYIEIGYSTAITNSFPVYFEAKGTTGWRQTQLNDIDLPTAEGVPNSVFYSGHSHMTDNFAIFGPFTVPAGGNSLLTFDQFYNIENAWDYGFVQVTTIINGQAGWTSLPLTGTQTTTQGQALQLIKDNVPGYSGDSGGWEKVTTDLNEYAGQTVLLAFRYSTDPATAGSDSSTFVPGWAIANVMIDGTQIDFDSARGISDMYHSASDLFLVNFVTYGDGYATDISNIYTLTVSNGLTNTLDLGAISLADAGFDEPGERGVMVVSYVPRPIPTDKFIGDGYNLSYADYRLTNLPPGIVTSNSEIAGDVSGLESVYANGILTTTVNIDNLGASPSIRAAQPITAAACSRIPDNATMNSGSESGDASFTTDMSTVGASFPAESGVCYFGSVETMSHYSFTMTAKTDVQIDSQVVVTTYFASDVSATPEQTEVDVQALDVRSPLDLSEYAAGQQFYSRDISTISFAATVINVHEQPRDVVLTFGIPENMSFEQVDASGTYTITLNGNAVLIEDTVESTVASGPQTYTIFLRPTTTLEPNRAVESVLTIQDIAGNHAITLNGSTAIVADILYFPLAYR